MLASSNVYLAPDVSLKRLETPCAYDRVTDDLFELTDDAFAFLQRALGGVSAGEADPEFLAQCLQEGILVEDHPGRRSDGRSDGRSGGAPALATNPATSPVNGPSLRYLLVHLTRRCNLACRHCYLGEAETVDLPFDQVRSLFEDFAAGGGLRLLLSGGEPLLHPRFWEIDALLPALDVRAVLLTNGTLIDDEVASRLHVHEVQVSLDGMEAAHDRLRGEGAFAAALGGLRAARAAGLQVSVASTVNRDDLGDFDDLEELVHGLGAWQWNIDVPAVAGRLGERPELLAPLAEAVRVQEHAFSAGSHGADEGQMCGAHLAAVLPDGVIVKCGLLREVHGGTVADGLQAAWQALPHLPTTALGEECRACAALQDCRGGCRFRAGGLFSEAPDPVQCHRFGVV